MINEKFYDEMKEHLIENINDTFTLNLAISFLEDSKKYKVDSEYYKLALIDIREICKYYGITPQENDNVTLRHILKDFLQIIDKAIGDDENDRNK